MIPIIKNFFVRPSWALISFTSLVFVVVVAVIDISTGYVEWRSSSTEYQKWAASDAPKICETYEVLCPRPNDQIQVFFQRRPVDEAWDACRKKIYDPQISCNLYNPGRFSKRFSETDTYTGRRSIGEELGSLIAFFCAIIFLFFSVRCFYAINHRGWERITLIGATFLSPALTYIFFKQDAPTYLIIFVLLFILIALPAIAKAFYFWIREGFDKPSGDAGLSKLKQIPLARANALLLTWKTIKPVLLSGAIILFFGFSFIFRPESTIKTMTMAFAQGTFIVLVFCLYRWLKK